jgi:hypothetical protein
MLSRRLVHEISEPHVRALLIFRIRTPRRFRRILVQRLVRTALRPAPLLEEKSPNHWDYVPVWSAVVTNSVGGLDGSRCRLLEELRSRSLGALFLLLFTMDDGLRQSPPYIGNTIDTHHTIPHGLVDID